MTTAIRNPKVDRALADIEAAKRGVCPAVAECLDAVADLITDSGDPDAVFAWLIPTLAERCGGSLVSASTSTPLAEDAPSPRPGRFADPGPVPPAGRPGRRAHCDQEAS